jgi:molybdopterin converting factor small subunit
MRADASTTALRVTLRFFAAARAAVGRDTAEVDLPAGSTIADALAAVAGQVAAPSSPAASAPAPAPAATSISTDAVTHAEAVFRRCSFLVNGVAVTGHARTLAADDRIDVMPPFAGG